MQATTDRLILSRNNQLLLISITKGDTSQWKRETSNPPQKCSLFEKDEWLACHEVEPWVNTSYISTNQNQ
ncbi:unnamed protein product [Rotaria magnacalcarata]|uniref:Uncharacterized protein n=1 Tax=Rotaria magnacalcarata TaxID=392030 RepID=A0A816N8I6_9BILA|nr:unnamed protein product [Rotaria magnacalcarata]